MKTYLLPFIPLLSLLAQASTPNIVLIMADDFGQGDVGRQHTERTGQPALAPTPTLDALADSGMWFTDAHSPTALCSPSRYAVMTGNYNYRSYAPWGVWGTFRPTAITEDDATLGTVAQETGYTTGFVGKWHLGGDFYQKNSDKFYRGDDRGDTPLNVEMNEWIAFGPQDLGFDYDYTLPTGVQGPIYVAFENGKWAPFNENSKLIHYDKNTAKDPFFISDKGPGTGDSEWDAYEINKILAEKATGFIKRSAQTKEPFFLCYWSPAVHIPHTPPVELEGRKIRGTTPTHHTDMNRVIDWEVEQIVTALKTSGAYENTLIMFTSDNGGLSDGRAAQAGHFSNGGLVRGTKNHAHEGGHLVPLIVSWPGVIPAGSRSDALINGTDILATIAEITGYQIKNKQAQDSYSFLPLLKGDDFEARDEVMLQAGANNELMLRQGDWKLIMQSDHKLTKMEPIALFNLANNPDEKEKGNLILNPEYASKVKSMRAHYISVRNNLNRTVPLSQ
ncbi:MAG: arylsulfatase [Opitutales bacterium]|jgi:arylsulfatase A|nr:arylsulfatase [Opitutales bacterium]MDP4644327.1 arylsulfatase [Opitutales bacterium]MDP4778068.1 arylsulfatase [Opitutales bacterium]MDP4879160.1 arylsulfatase [Opitutales bacterium]MDP4883421.1 arylsulfatase [Opitutales bacterium]